MYHDWIIERTEYYAKAETNGCDTMPPDDAAERMDREVIFKGFLEDPVEVYEKEVQINAKRKASTE